MERKKERKKRVRGIGCVQSVLRFVIENGRRIDFSKNLIRDFDDFSGRNFFFCYLLYSNGDSKDIEIRYS